MYIYPPTSSERRACETTAVNIIHAFQHPSPSSKAAAQAAQDDPCLQQPRLDGAKSDQLFFYRGHSSFKSGATGCHSPPDLGLPPLPVGPQFDAPACTGVPNSSFEHPV